MDTAVLDPIALSGVPLERIETEITELAAHLAAAECRWLLLIGEFDRREGFAQWGCRSTAHWLNWRCGLSLRAAYERVRVANALVELPLTRETFSGGELSYSKVRAISRVATLETEADYVELALASTASQLERMTGTARAIAERAAPRMHHERAVRITYRDDGSGSITIDLPPDKMALAVAGLEAMAETMALDDFVAEADDCSAEHTEEPSDPWSARMADAFCRLAELALDPEASERSFSDRFLLNVHFDLAVLGGDEDGRAEIEGGPMLSSEVLERLLCDGTCVPILEIEGKPVHAGNKTPTVSRRMRRTLRARDGGCRFPGCTNTKWVDAHHVIFKSRNGPTELWNLVLLCRFHHTSIHHRGFSIERHGGDFHFLRPDGTPVPAVPETARARGAGLVEQNRRLRLEITPDTVIPAWDGSPLTYFGLGVAVDHYLRERGLLN